MNIKKGFTLTEVLLAVMITAIIGVALASLTTAASRESGVGSSKVMLRNGVVRFLRMLRQDINGASRILYVSGNLSVANDTITPLLLVGKGVDLSGNAIGGNIDPKYVAYCFTRGNETAIPADSYVGGTITRREILPANLPANSAAICTSTASSQTMLTNVKYLNNDTYPDFKSPSFYALDRANGTLDFSGTSGVLRLQLIVELPGSSPVVNDSVEEIFLFPMGLNR